MNKKFSIFFLFIGLSLYAQEDITKAQNHLEKGEINQSRTILLSHLDSNPQDLKANLILGDIASFEKKWDLALSYYKKLLIKDPSNADYNFRYGGVLGLKAIYVSKIKAVVYVPDIKKYLEKAADLDPSHVKSRRALVELYMQLPMLLGGSEAKAQRFANELKNVAPLEAALSQAFILNETGKKDEAKFLIQKSLVQIKKPYTSSKENYLNYEYGKLTAEYNTDLQKGLKLLDAYILNYNYKDMHSLEWAYFRKAQIQAHLKNKAEAIKLINKALAINGNFEEAKVEKKRIQQL